MNPRLYRSNPDGRGHWKQEEIKWGNELSFPDFAGTTIEINHLSMEGTEFNMTKESDNIIPKDMVENFIQTISNSLWILYLEHGFTNPMILKVNDTGKVNLLMAHSCNKNTVVDVILKSGHTEVVKITK